jgi:hypothetical protein
MNESLTALRPRNGDIRDTPIPILEWRLHGSKHSGENTRRQDDILVDSSVYARSGVQRLMPRAQLYQVG